MKKVWIIIAAVVVFSLAVLFIGSRFVFYTDSEGFHISDKNAAQIYTDKDTKKFTEIEIKTDSTNIEFITAEEYGFEYMANSAIDTAYSNENGKLTITQSSKRLLFNFNLSGKSDYIKVYIPEEAEMKNVKISNASGNLTIAKLTSENLDIKAISGNIDITGIQSAGVQINNTSGNIHINSCKADTLDVTLISGQLKAKDLETGGLNAGVTSGNVELDGKLSGINEVKSISGNVTLNIIGEKKAYNSNISVLSGNVTVDGSNTKTYEYENADAVNSLKVDTTSGNVTVNFKGQ